MQCLELKIPPLPQLLTVGFGTAKPGYKHFSRRFDAYDVIIVRKGTLYISEDDVPFEIKEGDMLVLEPGKTHSGHKACEERTEMYWIHFLHPRPQNYLDKEDIQWNVLLEKNKDNDVTPTEQMMYLPKFAHFDISSIAPVLDEMNRLFRSYSSKNALQLQVLMSQFFAQIQTIIQLRDRSRSAFLAEKIIDYLQRHMNAVLKSKHMQETLHFQYDYLTRCLKKHTGMTPVQYLQTIRINHAKSLLENTDTQIQEIGERVGMGTIGYFNRVFRQMTGLTPGQYRASKYLSQ